MIEHSGVNQALGIFQAIPNAAPLADALRIDIQESSSPATANLKSVISKFKTAGDAVIEITIVSARATILIEGRIIDAGTLLKDSLKPLILVRLPAVYGAETAGKSDQLKEQAKDFEKNISKDKVRLKWQTGESEMLQPNREVNARIKEAFASGIVSAEMKFPNWQGRSLEVTAGVNTALSMTMTGPSLLLDGLEIGAAPISSTNPDYTVHLQILIKQMTGRVPLIQTAVMRQLRISRLGL